MNDGDYSLKTPFSLKYCSFIKKKGGTKKNNPTQSCIVFTRKELHAHRTVVAKIASYIIDQHQADNGKQVLIRQ